MTVNSSTITTYITATATDPLHQASYHKPYYDSYSSAQTFILPTMEMKLNCFI